VSPVAHNTPWWASEPSEDARDDGRDEAQPRDVHGHSADVCQICPICAALRVLEGSRPEVVEHLLEAARHLTLASKAVIDAYAEGFATAPGLERIPVDGE
jgi:hypothetical protein